MFPPPAWRVATGENPEGICRVWVCRVKVGDRADRAFHLQLKELKTELAGLSVAKVTGGAPNKLSKM